MSTKELAKFLKQIMPIIYPVIRAIQVVFFTSMKKTLKFLSVQCMRFHLKERVSYPLDFEMKKAKIFAISQTSVGNPNCSQNLSILFIDFFFDRHELFFAIGLSLFDKLQILWTCFTSFVSKYHKLQHFEPLKAKF